MTNEEKIKAVIEDIKPYINMDGGDIEFIKYDKKEKCVYVKLFGACINCMAQDDTLENNLLEAIKDEVPEVERIINTPL